MDGRTDRRQRHRQKLKNHVYIANTDKDCYLLHDRPVLSSGRTPHHKQNRNYLDYSQNLVMNPKGAQRQD